MAKKSQYHLLHPFSRAQRPSKASHCGQRSPKGQIYCQQSIIRNSPWTYVWYGTHLDSFPENKNHYLLHEEMQVYFAFIL